MKGAALAIIAAPLVLVLGIVIFLSSFSASAATCDTTGAQVNTADLPAGPIAGFSGDQLLNAADIMNAASALGLSEQAQKIGVTVAIGESGLVVLDHGDAAGPDSRGLFQQRANGQWGSYADRMDPTISATNFFKALENVDGWESMSVTEAAHAVQANAVADYYTPFADAAGKIVDALSGSTETAASTGCSVSGNAQQLAQQLMQANKDGKFTDSYHPLMITDEIAPMANGTASAECTVDTRVLQLLVLVLGKYGSLSISDLGRPCVGMTLDCATGSAHCAIPDLAVDFNSIGGKTIQGYNDDGTRDFLVWLDTIMPKGSKAGQSGCRSENPLQLQNITQFDDDCSHQHIDFSGAGNAGLNITSADATATSTATATPAAAATKARKRPANSSTSGD